jgi:hypothetical protein
VTTVGLLCQTHSITSGAIEVGLDGERAMKVVSQDWEPSPTDPDFDLIYDIRAKIKKLPVVFSWRWIKGHQDDMGLLQLDKWARINIQMDHHAKMHWRHSHDTPVPNHQFGSEQMSISFQGKKLSSFNRKELYTEIVGVHLKAYWKRKHDIPSDHLDSIAWDTQNTAFKGLPLGKQRWFVKFATGFCGLGKTLLLREYQDHSKCPCCDQDGEDNQHVLKCLDAKAVTKWTACLATLTAWLREKFHYR